MARPARLKSKLLKPPALSDVKRLLDSKLEHLALPAARAAWEAKAAQTREAMIGLFLRGHDRELLRHAPEVRWGETIDTGAGYRIRKLRYEGFPGLWVPGLLYQPDRLAEKTPVVLNPNGHHAGGNALAYKQARCINLAKRGILALSMEFIGMGELRANSNHGMIAYQHLLGREGVGVFYAAVKRALDVLLSHPNADPGRVAVTGLSGGGWQTLLISALDERVTVSVPVAGFSPAWQRAHHPEDIGDLEQLPPDLCTVADYDTLAALIAPRPLLLIYNKYDDCCFRPSRTRKSIYLPVKELYARFFDPDSVELYINEVPGTHNYEVESRERMYGFLNKHFGLDTPESELPWREELYSELELAVGIPPDNATLHSIAVQAIPSATQRTKPTTYGEAESRRRLRELVKLPTYSVKSERRVASIENDALIEQLVLDLETWRIPLTLERVGTPDSALLCIGEIKPKNIPPAASDTGLLRISCDILGTGEMTIPNGYHMLLQAAGERSLGMMVAQIGAIVDWIDTAFNAGGIHVATGKEYVGLAALVFASLFPSRLAAIDPAKLPVSLADLIKTPVPPEGSEALFCYGLLGEFDVCDLVDLAAPTKVAENQRGPLSAQVSGSDP